MREEEEEKEEELAEAAFPRPSRSSVPPPPPPPLPLLGKSSSSSRTGPMSIGSGMSRGGSMGPATQGAQAVATLRGGGCGGRPEAPLAAPHEAHVAKRFCCEDQRDRDRASGG